MYCFLHGVLVCNYLYFANFAYNIVLKIGAYLK